MTTSVRDKQAIELQQGFIAAAQTWEEAEQEAKSARESRDAHPLGVRAKELASDAAAAKNLMRSAWKAFDLARSKVYGGSPA